MTEPWSVRASWKANTSTGVTMRNSDDVTHMWTTGGPIPVSNPNENTVRQNDVSWRILKADSGVMTSTEPPGDDSLKAGMVWAGTAVNNGGNYEGNWNRYKILNGENKDGHNKVGNTSTTSQRTYLRIHEDGNYYGNPYTNNNTSSIGSEGCIALVPATKTQSTMSGCWDLIESVRKQTNTSSTYIPLLVYNRNGHASTTEFTNANPFTYKVFRN